MDGKQPGVLRTAVRVVVVAVALFGFAVFMRAQAWSQQAGGKDLFLANKCNRCHSIDSQQIARLGHNEAPPDLSKIGSKQTADWMVKFLNKDESLDGKKHPIKWKGSPEDLQTLANWLATLK